MINLTHKAQKVLLFPNLFFFSSLYFSWHRKGQDRMTKDLYAPLCLQFFLLLSIIWNRSAVQGTQCCLLPKFQGRPSSLFIRACKREATWLRALYFFRLLLGFFVSPSTRKSIYKYVFFKI